MNLEPPLFFDDENVAFRPRRSRRQIATATAMKTFCCIYLYR